MACTAGKTVNLKLTSADNTSIGAWFVFSDPFYQQLPYPPTSEPRLFLSPPRANTQRGEADADNPIPAWKYRNTRTPPAHSLVHRVYRPPQSQCIRY